MSRFLPHLATFVVAAASAYTGLATASSERAISPEAATSSATVQVPKARLGQNGNRGPQGENTARSAPSAASERTRPDSSEWSQRITERLSQLRPVQVSANTDFATKTGLAQRLAGALAHAPRGTRVAVHVRDLDTGETLFEHDADRELNPASNHKLLTTAAAIELLGPDYRFETRVHRRGNTLYLTGEGDPTLSLDALYALADETVRTGELGGVNHLVVDDSAFSARSFGPGYAEDAPGVSYMAPSGALSLNLNTVEVTVRPGEFGEAVDVQIWPPGAHVVVDSEARTGAGKALSVDTRADGDDTRVIVRGTLSAGHAPVVIRRRVTDPSRFTAQSFTHLLSDLSGQPQLDIEFGEAPKDAHEVALHQSLALSRALDPALKYSNNFCAEQILRVLGWRMTGDPGSWQNGVDAVAAYWNAIGHDDSAMDFINGSGLNRDGRATARALVDVVARVRAPGSAAAALLPTMAGGGGEGTLRLRVSQSDGRVRAKTGTMNGVTALSGVVASEDASRMLGFSVLVNGGSAQQGRALQDRMVLAMLANVDAA